MSGNGEKVSMADSTSARHRTLTLSDKKTFDELSSSRPFSSAVGEPAAPQRRSSTR